MTNAENPFAGTVAEYTDQRLLNIVRSPEDFSPKLVDASRFEAEKRGIYTIGQNEIPQQQTVNYLSIIRKKITQGVSIEECEKYLLDEGVNQEQTLSILDKAARTAELEQKRKSESSNSGPSIWTILFIIFIVVKIIIRLARN